MKLPISLCLMIASTTLMGATRGCQPPDDDLDGDGWSATMGDCDDSDPNVNPGADERCDGLDNDCDGIVDDDAVDAATWFADGDGDGHGAPGTDLDACDAPAGYVATADDCDDADPLTWPGAEEVCGDRADNDCDGLSDEDGQSPWYPDLDADGWGAGAVLITCAPPAGYVPQDGDCDDGDAGINPDALETCDSADQDCDSLVDEDAVDAPTWYADADQDGFGFIDDSLSACAPPAGYTDDATDCDDEDSAVHPGAAELCDDFDDDCDGQVDEDAVDTTAFWADTDGDGFGGAEEASFCGRVPPAGYVPNNADCDDTDPGTNPDAAEVCDGRDNNCDGQSDEGFDQDGDGWLVCAGDCDDTSPLTYPGAIEVVDGADNDCDGAIDEVSQGCGAPVSGAPSGAAVSLITLMAGALLRRRPSRR